MALFRRRSVLIAAIAALVGASLGASTACAAPPATGPAPLPDDMTIGNPKAKVQVIEYASASCPHCAHFNEVVFADFKTRWVDTGKVRYTLKEMLTEPATIAARAQRAQEQDGVSSTPTIFINGMKADPTPMTPADMDAAIAYAMKSAKRKGAR
jgi:protein-disulfide isomerase